MNATEAWKKALGEVMAHGIVTKPRGLVTKEILAHRSVVDMSYPILTSPERKLGYKFLAAEAAWILGGDNKVSTIRPYSKDISNFSDDGVIFFGAYGPKIVDQFDFVATALAKDRDTRQAVMTIWRENPPKTKDVPCTVSVQWLIREDKLDCVYVMRSSDLWLGHPYDVFNFSMLSTMLLVELRKRGVDDVELGFMAMICGSKHVYEKNFEGVSNVLESQEANPGPRIDPSKFDSPEDVVKHLWSLAESGGARLPSSWE